MKHSREGRTRSDEVGGAGDTPSGDQSKSQVHETHGPSSPYPV